MKHKIYFILLCLLSVSLQAQNNCTSLKNIYINTDPLGNNISTKATHFDGENKIMTVSYLWSDASTKYEYYIHVKDTLGNAVNAFHLFDTRIGTYGVYIKGMETDAAGNIYIGGYHYDTLFVNTDTIPNNNSAFTISSFIFKVSPTGIIEWYKTFGGKNDTDELWDLDVDKQGNVFFGLNSKDDVDIDGVVVKHSNLYYTNEDVVYGKFDTNGNLIWANHVGSTKNTDQRISALGIAENGYAYIAVYSYEDAGDNMLFHGYDTITTTDDTHAYLVKLNATNGNILKIKDISSFRIHDMCFDADNDVYVTGNHYSYSTRFDEINYPYKGFDDVLTMKFSPDFDILWYKGGSSGGDDRPESIYVSDSRVVVVGKVYGITYFDPFYLTNSDQFVVSYDKENGKTQWVKAIDEEYYNSSAYIKFYNVFIDKFDRTIIQGSFGDQIDMFGTKIEAATYSNFIAILDEYTDNSITIETTTTHTEIACDEIPTTVTLQTTATPNTGVTYSWYPDKGVNYYKDKVTTSVDTTTTFYAVVYKGDCVYQDKQKVTVDDPSNSSINVDYVYSCKGDEVQLDITTSAIDPTFEWSPSDGLSSTLIKNPILTVGETSMYFVDIISKTGCYSSMYLPVDTKDAPEVTIKPSSDTTLKQGESLVLTAETTEPSINVWWNESLYALSYTISEADIVGNESVITMQASSSLYECSTYDTVIVSKEVPPIPNNSLYIFNQKSPVYITNQYIQIGTEEKTECYIHDMQGKLVLQSVSKQIDITSIPQGVYTLTLLKADKSNYSIKFVK